MVLDIYDVTSFEERQNIRSLAQKMGKNQMAKAASPVSVVKPGEEILLTTPQAAKMLKTSTWVVRELIRKSKLKAHQDKTGKRPWRIQRSSLLALQESLKNEKVEQKKDNSKSNLQVMCKGPCDTKKPVRWIDKATGLCPECLELDNATRPGGAPPPKEAAPKRKMVMEAIIGVETEKHEPKEEPTEWLRNQLRAQTKDMPAPQQHKHLLLLNAFAAQMEAQALFMRALVEILK